MTKFSYDHPFCKCRNSFDYDIPERSLVDTPNDLRKFINIGNKIV